MCICACSLNLLDHVGAQVDIKSILNANPKTKEEFIILSRQVFELVIKRHQDKPLYAAFVEAHAKELASPLRDVEVRKVASGLTALANEKQKEAKEKTSGKKKKAPKPILGGSKVVGKCVSDFRVHPKFWILTLAVIGPIQTYTTKLWMISVTIQMTSCELVEIAHRSVSFLKHSASILPSTLHNVYVARVLVMTIPVYVVPIRLRRLFRHLHVIRGKHCQAGIL